MVFERGKGFPILILFETILIWFNTCTPSLKKKFVTSDFVRGTIITMLLKNQNGRLKVTPRRIFLPTL